ncbi:hypothetical protein DAA61_39205 [Bradyrhizobium sp. WBAH33]|nr:hypothetical protein DAA61_39205 [Bradyrhizobium sp. WBAH33]
MRQQFRFLRGTSLAAYGTMFLAIQPAWAAGSNMPWEQPLNQILQSVEGPVARRELARSHRHSAAPDPGAGGR